MPHEPEGGANDDSREGGAFHPGARAIAFLAALVTGVYLASAAARLVERGFPATAAALTLSAAPLVGLLAALALAPGGLQRVLGRVSAVDLSRGGHVLVLVIMAATLFVLFGFNSLTDAVATWESIARHGESFSDIQDISGRVLIMGLMVQFLLLTLPAVAWVMVVNGRSGEGVAEELDLTPRNAGVAALMGVAIALGAILALGALAFAAQWAGFPLPENQRALAIARALTVPTAILVALLSSVGEEVFFRGFLQQRVGLWGQAALFSVAHVGYLNVLQIVVTFVLGVAFGLALMRSRSLVAPISGHFAFNLIMILLVVLTPEAA